MTTLVLTLRLPRDTSNGYDLRVLGLCRELSGPVHLRVISIDLSGDDLTPEPFAEFSTVTFSPPPVRAERSLFRHLRFNENSYLRLAFPAWFSKEVASLQEQCRALEVRRLVVFGAALAGLAHAADVTRVILDVCDSQALALRRALPFARDLSFLDRLKRRLELARHRRAEVALPNWFNHVTAVSEADAGEIIGGDDAVRHKVHTVPNGVDESYLEPLPEASLRQGVAFWGNLDFLPNREALRFFIRSVYVPHLRDKGVNVRIVGRDAEPWLVDLAQRDPQVELVGFVSDLPGAVCEYPVMVNPMVIGSGLKNKVLESFALGLAVVSTRLGVEGLREVEAGKHFISADDPKAFAHAVLELLGRPERRAELRLAARSLVEERYRWSEIGQRFDALASS